MNPSLSTAVDKVVDNSNGRAWARFWLIVALIVSITANVTHTVLADSAITLWLRVPGAVVWPVFTFAGIEILVRIIWERRWTHGVARIVLLAAAVPAAITSYEHQYTLLGMMGERQLIQIIGPAAIDGLMIGCTMALLFTRESIATAATIDGQGAEPAPDVDELLRRHGVDTAELPVPVSPAPAGANGNGARNSRPARAPKEGAEQAVRMMLDGRAAEAIEQGLMGASTLRRYQRVLRALTDDPQMNIDFAAEKVRPELVAIIRDYANRERVR